MSWLRKTYITTDPDVLDVAIPFSVLEEVFESEHPEIERLLAGLQEQFDDLAVRAEVREQVAAVAEQLQAGEVPDELFSLEQQLFKTYTDKHPEEVQKLGLDTVHNQWRTKFVQYLQENFLEHLKAELAKESKKKE